MINSTLNIPSIISPKQPIVIGWQQLSSPPSWVSLGYPAKMYLHPATGLCVISAVEVAADQDGIDRGPEYHLSITKNGSRCTQQEALEVLRQFGLDGSEQDNHVPSGIARHFWQPVAESLIGMDCACKDSEPVIREDKGDYEWRGV